MKEVEAVRFLNAVASMIENSKLSGGALIPDAETGFNLACDFLADRVRKFTQLGSRNLLNHVDREPE